MDTQTKTPVDIIQELLAIHATRKEAAEKLMQHVGETMHAKLPAVIKQSDGFIGALMNELSNFGDGVQGVVSRDNEYQETWKQTTQKIDQLQPEQGKQAFQKMEDSLKQTYQHILDTKSNLPDSLVAVLEKQAGDLSHLDVL